MSPEPTPLAYGAYVDFWKRLDVEYLTGLDISQAVVGHVRERHPEFRLLHRDITEPTLRSGCGGDFDLGDRAGRAVPRGPRPTAEARHPGPVAASTERRPRLHPLALVVRLFSGCSRAPVSRWCRVPVFVGMIQTNDCASTRAGRTHARTVVPPLVMHPARARSARRNSVCAGQRARHFRSRGRSMELAAGSSQGRRAKRT